MPSKLAIRIERGIISARQTAKHQSIHDLQANISVFKNEIQDCSRTLEDSDINFRGHSLMLLLRQCLSSKECISPRVNPKCILVTKSPAIIKLTVI